MSCYCGQSWCRGPETHIRPSEAQKRFLQCPADEVFYGGAGGGGKSYALLLYPLRWIQYPKFRGIIFRRTIPELHDYLVPKSAEVYAGPAGGMRAYNENRRLWTFPSGAVIKLGAMQYYPKDAEKYDSSEWSYAAYDELTTFPEERYYTHMLTRLRSTDSRIPTRIRSASNPGRIGAHWVQKRFQAWLGDPDAETDEDAKPWAEPGQVLVYLRGGSAHEDEEVPIGTPESLTRTFFGATVDDNPYIDREAYKANLRGADLLTYRQRRHGDWMARPAPGMFFPRHFWTDEQYLPAGFVAPDAVKRVRYWDLAATPSDKDDGAEDKGPDWLAGVRMCRRRSGAIVVEDVARARIAESEVEDYILVTADADREECGRGNVLHIVEQEPGASGKIAATALVRALVQRGHNAKMVRPSGNKVDRARPMAGAARAGLIFLVRGPWNRAFIREGEMFPKGKKDQIDGLSGGGAELSAVRSGKAKTGKRRSVAAARGGF